MVQENTLNMDKRLLAFATLVVLACFHVSTVSAQDNSTITDNNQTNSDNHTNSEPYIPAPALIATATAISTDYTEFKDIVALTGNLVNMDANNLTTEDYKGFNFGDYFEIIISCDADYERKELYYYSFTTKDIQLLENFTTDMVLEQMNASEFQSDTDKEWVMIAVDWVNHNVYYTQPLRGEIHVKKGGKSTDNTAYKTLFTGLNRPQGIAVDPIRGLLFWGNGLGKSFGRSTLSGRNGDVNAIPLNDYTKFPEGLTLDSDKKLIYWGDSHMIKRISYEGGPVESFMTKGGGAYIYDVDLYQSLVIATNIGGYYDSYIHFYDVESGEEVITPKGSPDEYYYGICGYVEKEKPSTDACANFGCSHICVAELNANMVYIPTCLCYDGFEVNTENNKECVESPGYPFNKAVVINTGSKLCVVSLRVLTDHKQTDTTCFYTAPDGKNITAFDIDMLRRLVYFSMGKTIYSAPIDKISTNVSGIVDNQAKVIAISYDWTDGFLYYALDDMADIHKINPTNEQTSSSIDTSGEHPKVLVVSPHDRKIFWVTETDSEYSIKYLSLMSNTITTLNTTKTLRSVTHIYHDILKERLYILDMDSYGFMIVVQMEYDGTYADFNIDVSSSIKDFAIYQGYILVGLSDGTDITLQTADQRYSPYTLIASGTLEGLGDIVGLKVLDLELLQPQFPNPCGATSTNGKGGCDHFCSPNGDEVKCSCQIGFRLVNETKCITTPLTDNFLLVLDATYNMAGQISINNQTEFIGLITPSLGTPQGALYNYIDEVVYITNGDMGDIIAMYLNGTVLYRVSDGGTSYPDRFAFDPSTGTLFYTAVHWFSSWYNDESFLVARNKKGEEIRLVANIHYPRGLVVYPSKGYLFYTDHGDYPGIYRINMDGSNFTTIIDKDIVNPFGLAIDYIGNRLYWADSTSDKIESCDLDGNNRIMILEDPDARPTSLKYLDGYLYYAAQNNLNIKKVKVTNPSDVSLFGPPHGLGVVRDFDIYISGKTDNIPVNTDCSNNNGGCSGFCFPVPGGYNCACIQGSTLLKDNKTCDNVPRCPSVIPKGSVNETLNCLLVEGNICDYQCTRAWKKKANVDKLTCTSEVDPDFDNVLLWDNDDPCEEIFCPMTVPTITLDMFCDRKVDTDCFKNFTCNPGYERNPLASKLMCGEDGQWMIPESLCIPKCPHLTSEMDKAVLHPGCNRDIRESCRVVCDEGYKNAQNASRIICLPGSRWNMETATVCQEIICKDFVDDGFIVEGGELNCSRKLGSVCNYKCDNRFLPNPRRPNITCEGLGLWSHVDTDDDVLCSLIPEVVESDVSRNVAIGVGVGAAVVVLLILLLLIFLYRSGRLFGDRDKAVLTSTSFDNPRYSEAGLPTNPTGVQSDRSFGYATLDEDRIVDTSKAPEHQYDNPLHKS